MSIYIIYRFDFSDFSNRLYILISNKWQNRSLTRKYFQVVRGIFQHCINQFNYSEINELDLSG